MRVVRILEDTVSVIPPHQDEVRTPHHKSIVTTLWMVIGLLGTFGTETRMVILFGWLDHLDSTLVPPADLPYMTSEIFQMRRLLIGYDSEIERFDQSIALLVQYQVEVVEGGRLNPLAVWRPPIA